MMAYQQRVNQFKSRIDFDDPSTTKPPSLAKSAVLQALEDEERQQSRGKGLQQQQRASRTRQREVAPASAPERTRTPCINRETVMRINRRPHRHRSCDSFWPPARSASPLDRTPAVGGADEEVPAGNVSPRPAVSDHRWVRFENGNISPPVTQPRAPRLPTPYPSPTLEDEQGSRQIFDQFAAAMATDQQLEDQQRQHEHSRRPDLVENVPLIDAVLDDLLTFSKTLVLRQSCLESEDLALATGREEAKIAEINDDNLINLLADDDNSGAQVADGPGTEMPKGDAERAALWKSLPSKQYNEGEAPERQENSGDESFREEKCDWNVNEEQNQTEQGNQNRSVDDSKNVLNNYLNTRRNQEDIFTNVAIFNWNPLDVYQQHGLFMIDPRFALADQHAAIPASDSAVAGRGQSNCLDQDDSYNKPSRTSNGSQKRNDAHLNSPKREQAANCEHPARHRDDDDAAAIGIVEITDGADPSSENVNSFATQRAEDSAASLLESHKIPNDRASPAVDHFYDSAHVEYPVRSDLRLGMASDAPTSTTTTKECHQSPVESDYDNDPTKSSATDATDGRPPRCQASGEEGLKRVAWPPPLDCGDDYEQHPVQNKCSPQAQQQQPYQHQQYYQQRSPQFQQQQQQQYHPPQQQQQQQQQQTPQHQPQERIIPIQRVSSLLTVQHKL